MRSLQNWLDRLCYKHPKLGIPGLMRYIVIGNVIIYLLDLFSKGDFLASSFLCFSREAILSGQIWRLVTFIFVPVSSSNVIFFLITLYFYYFIGKALEQQWGSSKFTVFYLFGVVLNIVAGFLVGSATMYYVNMSMFFAFATLYPDLQVLLFFIIPLKAKWLAWANGAWFAYIILRYLFAGEFLLALLPIVALANYLIFFAGDFFQKLNARKRQAAFHAAQQGSRRGPKVVNFHDAKTKTKSNFLHKCAVCGRTDVTDPNLDFRYCSKCNGYYCYCQDHINSHIHIQ